MLTSISNMAELLKEIGELQEVRPLYEGALRVRRETLGNCHLFTLTSINIMAVLLHGMSELQEAREL